jgi:hypothetical protein
VEGPLQRMNAFERQGCWPSLVAVDSVLEDLPEARARVAWCVYHIQTGLVRLV